MSRNHRQFIVLCVLAATFAGELAVARAATWTDTTGKFSVTAELIEIVNEIALLRKLDGEELRVPLARLSVASRKQAIEQLKANAPAAIRFGAAQTYRVRLGLEMTARSNVTGLQGIMAIPMEWPEQQVELVREVKSPEVRRITFRTLEDGARQMIVHVPRLDAGQSATGTVTFDVTRRPTEKPKSVNGLVIPTRVSRDLRHYLTAGPLTPSKHKSITTAKDAAVDPNASAWAQVQAIHQHTLKEVRYEQRAEIKDAATALAEGVGDCQELSSLFVAMCRAHRVPARCVWIPGHSYAEFYLVDAAGTGHWYPVESTNTEQFGYIPRTDIIMQKGDNFKLPELPGRQHYARTVLFGKTRDNGAQPTFREISEIEPINE